MEKPAQIAGRYCSPSRCCCCCWWWWWWWECPKNLWHNIDHNYTGHHHHHPAKSHTCPAGWRYQKTFWHRSRLGIWWFLTNRILDASGCFQPYPNFGRYRESILLEQMGAVEADLLNWRWVGGATISKYQMSWVLMYQMFYWPYVEWNLTEWSWKWSPIDVEIHGTRLHIPHTLALWKVKWT